MIYFLDVIQKLFTTSGKTGGNNSGLGLKKTPVNVCVNSGNSPLSSELLRTQLWKRSLEIPKSGAHTIHMSTKQIVQDLLQRLPEDVSLHDVAQEIEFIAGIRQGLAEIERGERIPIEEIERELPSWVIK